VDLKAYRRRHHLHHRHTQTPEDPDLVLSAPLPVSRGRLALALLGDLGGWTALTRIARWRPRRDGFAQTWRRVRVPLLANAALCAGLTALGGWPLYLLVWVLPWATWFQLVTRIRDIAEHGLVHDAQDPLRNTRTIGAGLLARTFVAPYGVNYHLEHHLLVFVPCWKLREVQALLLDQNLGGRMERATSYAEVLARVTTAKV
jgi:fatty acid desaturase